MMYSDILNKLGPCGLNCSGCFAFVNGKIKQLSIELKKELGNFNVYAERFVNLLNETVFLKYNGFEQMLTYFANVSCQGCRKDNCKLFASCNVKECTKSNNVDFCFQCKEFPCKKHGFDEHLEKRWININYKMKEAGIENYFNEIKDIPRY